MFFPRVLFAALLLKSILPSAIAATYPFPPLAVYDLEFVGPNYGNDHLANHAFSILSDARSGDLEILFDLEGRPTHIRGGFDSADSRLHWAEDRLISVDLGLMPAAPRMESVRDEVFLKFLQEVLDENLPSRAKKGEIAHKKISAAIARIGGKSPLIDSEDSVDVLIDALIEKDPEIRPDSYVQFLLLHKELHSIKDKEQKNAIQERIEDCFLRGVHKWLPEEVFQHASAVIFGSRGQFLGVSFNHNYSSKLAKGSFLEFIAGGHAEKILPAFGMNYISTPHVRAPAKAIIRPVVRYITPTESHSTTNPCAEITL